MNILFTVSRNFSNARNSAELCLRNALVIIRKTDRKSHNFWFPRPGVGMGVEKGEFRQLLALS